MRLPGALAVLSTLLGIIPCVLSNAYPRDVVDGLALTGLEKLRVFQASRPPGGCTLETAAKRREWSDLPIPERHAYIDAVLCLQKLPPRFPEEECPGCRSRYDDFVAVHIQRTPVIHSTANFLAWHRYFVWAYETALRDECGYKGYQPYWNLNRYLHDLINSPIFNGNDSSMGGNGLHVAYGGIPIPDSSPQSFIDQAEGGGCITSGPFKEFVPLTYIVSTHSPITTYSMQVNLGPSSVAVMRGAIPPNPRADWLGYNPRCLRRDVNKKTAAFSAVNYTYSLIAQSRDITEFQSNIEGRGNAGPRGLGVHVSGHYAVGGDPGGDLYVGPGEPTFFLHHAMIDRIWWIWQMQGLPDRLAAVSGTITMKNEPPSRNGTLDDEADIGVLGASAKLVDLMNTIGGKGGAFCYVYDQ